RKFLEQFGAEELARLFIVSEVVLSDGEGAEALAGEVVEGDKYESDRLSAVVLLPQEYKKCDRCWRYRPEVGQPGDNPGLCTRCAEVMAGR
ncbi:MAG: zinc finger domain-containing protein, partial [Planctomycetia bacterium]|nr:zinc finger domain-containing protein [Planctomycetia bacterium]